jgi:PhoH-like ATPase
MAKKNSNKKVFVLDTNVLLHDHKCIYHFEENDIVLPITSLEELDKFKKGNDQINYNAREFTREIDKLTGDKLFNGGVSLGDDLGKLSIMTVKPFSDASKDSFPDNTADHRILAIAEYLHLKSEGKKVVLISKDINLRVKAKSIGLMAQDYESDKITDIDYLTRSYEVDETISPEHIAEIYNNKEGVSLEKLAFKQVPLPNQYFILKNGNQSVLAYYDAENKTMRQVEKKKTYGIEPRNAEQTFSLEALLRKDVSLVALTGKAGTGKTLLALAAALQQNQMFNQILLARPIVPLSNRDIGYLPGDIKDKIGPYMLPLYDNLSFIKHRFNINSKEYQNIENMQKEEKLIISPLAFIRGRSLSDVFFIIDESQNLTPHEVKTIITRAGEGAKMVFTGDIEQIDSPYLDAKSNGLSYLVEKMKGQKVFAHVNLVKGERSYLAELASNIL